MNSTYLDSNADAATLESSRKSVFGKPLTRLRRLFCVQGDRLCEQLGCAHEFVFDEINDVYCKHCRKDFTG
jgi:hypothetical protein